jgi:predicted short-subunit dehydrogenase-like oxidoreductase (DUF2520 family)
MFAILGSGRLARHFSFYLSSLDLKPALWSRNQDPLFNTRTELNNWERLRLTLQPVSHVLLAVNDDSIAPLASQVTQMCGPKRLVHFSGARSIPGVGAAHPLMTFGENLETPDWYLQIPFAIDQGSKFADLLPGLPNAHYEIPAGQRPLYHALCSLAGNSTFMLWQKIGEQLETKLGLPRELLRPFLHQVVMNSSLSGEKNFTGPVARGDWTTVRGHLASLEGQPELLGAYRSYLQMAHREGFDLPEDLT